MRDKQGEFFGIIEALEQQQRMAQAGLAQCQSAFELDEGKSVSDVSQRSDRKLEAVAIRIRLDDGPMFCSRGLVTRHSIVVTQCGKINGGANRTRHKNDK